MKRATISAKIVAGSALVALLLVATFVPVFLAMNSAREAEHALDRSNRQTNQVTTISGLVVDLETGSRGYLLTREERFLEPWERARRLLPGYLERLEKDASGTDDQAASRTVAGAVRAYITEWSEPLVATARSDPQRAARRIMGGEGRRLLDGIRRQFEQLRLDAERRIQDRRSARDAAETRALRLAVGGLVASLLLVSLFAVLLRRAVGRPLRQLGEAARRLGDGELGTRVPEDGPPEYARLASTFNVMAASLQSSRGKLTASNDELLAARADAERANQAKSEFLSRMSHELRTPLNSVLGFAELLAMDDLEDEHRHHVGQIRRSGKHLLDLINEVLDISRIEAGNMAVSEEAVELRPAVADALAMIAPLAAERDIALEPAYGDIATHYVRADQQRLKQVLLNLLTNAVKYNHRGGRVEVECATAEQGAVRIGVRDTGPGIPEEKLSRLFTPFDRLGAEQEQEAGTGLGLALSRRLVELMGGRLWAESVVGEGTVLWIELQCADAPSLPDREDDHGEPPVLGSKTGGLTVLYIEDNAVNFKLVERALARLDETRLLAAMHGGLGVELATEHLPDVVLLDMHLPDISGPEVLARLKADPRTAAIPVIILSADATEHQIRRVLEAGAHAYLTKPLDLTQFLETVESAAASGRARRPVGTRRTSRPSLQTPMGSG